MQRVSVDPDGRFFYALSNDPVTAQGFSTTLAAPQAPSEAAEPTPTPRLRTLRPRSGVAAPKVVPELMGGVPEKITRAHLEKSREILREGSVSFLRYDMLGDHQKLAMKCYVTFAVHKLWMHHAPEKLIALCKKVGETTKKGNTLYTLHYKGLAGDGWRDGDGETTHVFVGYTCPSTGKQYLSSVPRAFSERDDVDGDDAMAWKFKLTKEEYLQLMIET
jgi:hypothetical protein